MKLKKYINNFCDDLLIMKRPNLIITDQFMNDNLGLYYPENQTLIFSEHLIKQLPKETVLALVRHELIHHYCSINNLGAKDVDNDFINLIIKFDAFVSQEEEAQRAYKTFIANFIKNGSGFASEDFPDSKLEVFYNKWLLKQKQGYIPNKTMFKTNW